MIDPRLFETLPLLADGSIVSCLEPHPDLNALPVESLNQNDPERVLAAHGEFARAGARLLRANTAGANALALGRHGLAGRAEALNNSGVSLARAAAGQPSAVMGVLAPLPSFAPDDPPTPQQRERAYGEQLVYLSDTGVDFILLEHFTRLEEVLHLTRLIKGSGDAPVLALLQFDPEERPAGGGAKEGSSVTGSTAEEAARRLADAGADALGISCARNPRALPALVESLLAPGLPLAVMGSPIRASAGAPGRAPRSPEAFARSLHSLAAAGVSILGGCCGATPRHIQALSKLLGRRR